MNNRLVPTLTMTLHNQAAASVTIQADKTSVMITYWDARENVVAVRDFPLSAHPELAVICKHRAYDIEWELEMVLDLLDNVDENEPIAPAWQWAGVWEPTTTPDFRNLPQQQASVA